MPSSDNRFESNPKGGRPTLVKKNAPKPKKKKAAKKKEKSDEG